MLCYLLLDKSNNSDNQMILGSDIHGGPKKCRYSIGRTVWSHLIKKTQVHTKLSEPDGADHTLKLRGG